MATTADSGMLAGSNIVTGVGTASAQFTLPGSPLYIVQSVVATVDNTAGGATTATLTFADTNGEVIAKRPQGDTIPAGDTGTATFALRLSASGASGIRFNKTNRGGFLTIQLGSGLSYTLQDSTGAALELISENGRYRYFVPVGGFWAVFRGGGSAVLEVFDDRDFQVVCSDWRVTATGDTTLTLSNTTTIDARTVAITSNGATWQMNNPGNSLTVLNSAGSPIFRIDENGDLFGLTGKALTFSL
jgi:hypothetical protein